MTCLLRVPNHPNLYLHSNGNYYFRTCIHNRIIQFSYGVKNLAIAKELYVDTIKQLVVCKISGKSPFPDKRKTKEKRIKLDLALYDWLKSGEIQKNVSSTIYGKKKIRDLFIASNVKYMDEFSQTHLNKIFEILDKENTAQNSLRTYQILIKSFINYCIKKGHYTIEEKNKLIFRKLKIIKKDAKCIITESDYQKLLSGFKDDPVWQMYFKVLWNTGMRPHSEAFNLKRSDILPDWRGIQIYQNKTSEYKTIALEKEFSEELKLYCKIYKLKDDDFLFKNKIHKGKQSDNCLRNSFKSIIKKIGLNPYCTLYSFRHSFACRLLKDTGNIDLVSRQLGHTTTDHTRLYVHMTLEDDIKMIEQAKKNNSL